MGVFSSWMRTSGMVPGGSGGWARLLLAVAALARLLGLLLGLQPFRLLLALAGRNQHL